MTPSDFLNPVVGGRVVVGPHTPTTSRPPSCASQESSGAASAMSDRQAAIEEKMESLLETVRALSRQSSRHSDILEPPSPASPPPSPDREDAYSDISEAEPDNDSVSSDGTVDGNEEEVMETEEELSDYEDEEVNEAVRNSVITVGYAETPGVLNSELLDSAGRESADCVVAAGLETFEDVGVAGLETCFELVDNLVAAGVANADNVVAAGLCGVDNVGAAGLCGMDNVVVAGPSDELPVEMLAGVAREESMECESEAMDEPSLVPMGVKPQEAMNKARAMLNILEPVGRGGNLPEFVGPFVRPVPWTVEPSRVIHLRSVIQRVYLPGGGVMETETVVKGPVVVDRAQSP